MKAPAEWTLGDLKPVEYNPRRITDEQADALRRTISGFGFLQPLVVNTFPGREGRLVGGEQRWRQLSALHGLEAAAPEILSRDADGNEERRPGIVFVRLPLPRERELNVRLNRIGGDWDWAKLESFEQGELLDWGFQHFDFKRPKQPDLKIESEGGEDDGAGDGEQPPPETAQPETVRQAYLFCTPEDHAQLLLDIEKLAAKYGTDNPTDTICAVMRSAAAAIAAGGATDEEGT